MSSTMESGEHVVLWQIQLLVLTGWISPIIKVSNTCYRGFKMVFKATFNNISAMWWRSVLLVEETGIPGENHQPVTSH